MATTGKTCGAGDGQPKCGATAEGLRAACAAACLGLLPIVQSTTNGESNRQPIRKRAHLCLLPLANQAARRIGLPLPQRAHNHLAARAPNAAHQQGNALQRHGGDAEVGRQVRHLAYPGKGAGAGWMTYPATRGIPPAISARSNVARLRVCMPQPLARPCSGRLHPQTLAGSTSKASNSPAGDRPDQPPGSPPLRSAAAAAACWPPAAAPACTAAARWSHCRPCKQSGERRGNEGMQAGGAVGGGAEAPRRVGDKAGGAKPCGPASARRLHCFLSTWAVRWEGRPAAGRPQPPRGRPLE